jgi:glycosyltransferase involved in cell wall biosynthesis
VEEVKVCFIGKYPPIEGGVARDTFWTAFALAQQGFQVHVVTNAQEVEDEFRVFEQPWDAALPTDPRLSAPANLTVHYSSSADRPRYIPWANPFVTKLAAVATDVIRQEGCELIYSHYFEPYALAAYLAARWTDVPFGVRHAGSDVARLFRHPDLRTAYTEVVRAADYVFASPSTLRPFLALGVELERLYRPPPPGLPEQYFHPTAVPLDVNALLSAIAERLPRTFYDGAYHSSCQRRFDPSRPTIGIYGKVGERKGSFDLIRALGKLKREGLAFNLLALTQGRAGAIQQCVRELHDNALERDAWLLPFIPHWYVPNFIKACTAVCFLERDFPIPIHHPIVPREVLACGTCLVLSREIAEKQTYHEALRDAHNVFLVDPRNLDELASALRRAIRDPARSHAIGANGRRELYSDMRSLEVMAPHLAQAFADVHRDAAARRRAQTIAATRRLLVGLQADDPVAAPPRSATEEDREGQLRVLAGPEVAAIGELDRRLAASLTSAVAPRRKQLLREAYSLLFRLEPRQMERYVERHYRQQPKRMEGPASDDILAFGEFMERTLVKDASTPFASDLARYERLVWWAERVPGPQDTVDSINAVLGDAPTPLNLDSRPCLAEDVRIEAFRYDVLSIDEALRTDQPLGDWREGSYCLLFQRVPRSLAPRALSVHPVARFLLALCDGRRPVRELIRALETLLRRQNLDHVVLQILDDFSAFWVLSS